MFDTADLTRQCRKAAADEVTLASDDELLVAAVEFQVARSAFDAAEAHVLGELRVRGVTDRCFGLKTARWVAAHGKVDHRPVARRIRLGLRLRQLPVVDAAVADGTISADHAAVLVEAAANPRIGDEIAATQALWVDAAAETSFVDWSHQLQQTVLLLDQDGGYDPDRDRDRQRAQFTTFDDGLTRLAVDLVGADALEVRQLVEAQADRLFHQLKGDADRAADLAMPGRATLLAMALVELVRRGSVVDRDTTNGPVVDVTLVIEANRPTNVATEADVATGPTTESNRPDEATEAVGEGEGGCLTPADLFDHCGPAKTVDGDLVHPEVAAILLCDPIITVLVVDLLGVPLDMGRKIRLVNRDQRRALTRRDGGCIFPGCDCPASWCDAHHVIWWERQGPTDIWNLALLCRSHHGVTHRRGWTMTAAGRDWFTWTTPLGDTLHSQRQRGRSPTAHPAPHLCPA